jgi:thiol-disulfide isomerase/thioredoxin
MKLKLIVAGAMSFLAVACTQKISDTTTLIGKFENKIPDEVHIRIPKVSIDTVLKVKNGAFKIKVPVDVITTGMIEYTDNSATFVPDGTTLTFAFNDEAGVEITSNKPKISVQAMLNEYDEWARKFMAEYNKNIKSLSDSSSLSPNEKDSLEDEYMTKAQNEYNDYNLGVITKNKNNYLSLIALQGLSLADPQKDSLIKTLDSTVINTRYVKSVINALKARKTTAEGKTFIDFSIVQTPGDTVRFSNYVGKGKYLLVDFWASWCGPCKREIPNVAKAYKEYHGKNFDVLSVAVWDNPKETKDTAAVYGVKWNQIINAKNIPTDIYGIEGIPHIILFGPDGTILKRNLRGSEIERTIAEYVDPVKN